MVKGVIIVSEPERIKILADETRFEILHLLRRGPMSIRELTMMLHRDRTTIYRHIKTLEKAGFVEEIGKEGAERIYARTARIFMIRPEKDEKEVEEIREKYFGIEAEAILNLLKHVGFWVEDECRFVKLMERILKEIDENSKEYLEKLRQIDITEVEFLYLMNTLVLLNSPKLQKEIREIRNLLKLED